MNQGIDWNKLKRALTLISAIGLMIISAIGFNNGLQFGGEYGWIVAPAMWVAFTIVQFVGNDMENHDDWVFTMLWVFTYMVGIGAGSWAIYNIVNIPIEPLRWACAIGIGGAAEIAPERLIVMFLRSGLFPRVKIRSAPIPVERAPQIQRPSHNDSRDNNQRSSYKPQHRPDFSNMPKKGSDGNIQIRRGEPPTYNNTARFNRFQDEDDMEY